MNRTILLVGSLHRWSHAGNGCLRLLRAGLLHQGLAGDGQLLGAGLGIDDTGIIGLGSQRHGGDAFEEVRVVLKLLREDRRSRR